MAHGESLSRFTYTVEVRPGKVSLSDFNFKKPSLSLLASSSAKDDTNLEAHDYPGEYDVPGDGTALSKVRLEEWRTLRVAAGAGSPRAVDMAPPRAARVHEGWIESRGARPHQSLPLQRPAVTTPPSSATPPSTSSPRASVPEDPLPDARSCLPIPKL